MSSLVRSFIDPLDGSSLDIQVHTSPPPAVEDAESVEVDLHQVHATSASLLMSGDILRDTLPYTIKRWFNDYLSKGLGGTLSPNRTSTHYTVAFPSIACADKFVCSVMSSGEFECSFLHGLVLFSTTTPEEEIVALDPKVSLFPSGAGRDNFAQWFGRLPENVDFKGWEHPVYRHTASLYMTNGVHTSVLLVPGMAARDIPTVTYSSSQLFLVNNAVGLGTAWKKIPGLLLAPCNAIPCHFSDIYHQSLLQRFVPEVPRHHD
jgi:hypothetical protein